MAFPEAGLLPSDILYVLSRERLPSALHRQADLRLLCERPLHPFPERPDEVYDDGCGGLSGHAEGEGEPMKRLRSKLGTIAVFAVLMVSMLPILSPVVHAYTVPNTNSV